MKIARPLDDQDVRKQYSAYDSPAGTSTSARISTQLPIFEIATGSTTIIYTPGKAAVVSREQAARISEILSGSPPQTASDAALTKRLIGDAESAASQWLALTDRAFSPVCLTTYLSNECNLRCVYCYSAGPGVLRSGAGERLDIRAVEAAARLVASNCSDALLPFHLVLHGGGEPTLHWKLMQNVVTTTRQVAEEYSLAHWSYISTSGVVSETKARWLAQNIDHISISVDGMPGTHDKQRPLRGGRPTFEVLARTADTIGDVGVARLSFRCTITSELVERQAELLADLHRRFGVKHFVYEPAYRARARDPWALTSRDAARFCRHFICAQQIADALDCVLDTSGVRLDEIHGPFCNTIRDVLQLGPDNSAVSCFVATDGTQREFEPCRIGRWNPSSGAFELDQDRIRKSRTRATAIPSRCERCHNIYHCARDCPDVCPDYTLGSSPESGGFRCEVQKRLALSWIVDSVGPKPASEPWQPGELDTAIRLISETPDSVPIDRIVKSWLYARHRQIHLPRRAPDPVWLARGFDLEHRDACREVVRAAKQCDPNYPISVYVHVPFCDRSCNFCDCYTVLAKHGESPLIRPFLGSLSREIEAWGEIESIQSRPVTTIHFGGGTPSLLSISELRAVVARLKKALNITEQTEWALESTTSQLTTEMCEGLAEIGFRRMHVGVQSLDDRVRVAAGRAETTTSVVEKVGNLIALGMITTVDLIYGLPLEDVDSLARTIEVLTDTGVHGFSAYRLNVTQRNRRFAARFGLAPQNYTELFFKFHIVEALLRSKGYTKTHFAHYSRPGDSYLYYTHTRRGEDLLALGPTADGVIGRLHYVHGELSHYLRESGRVSPAIRGATYETEVERRAQGAIAGLMTARLSSGVMASLGVGKLLNKWTEDGLLAPIDGDYELTASGSFLVGDMIRELTDAVS